MSSLLSKPRRVCYGISCLALRRLGFASSGSAGSGEPGRASFFFLCLSHVFRVAIGQRSTLFYSTHTCELSPPVSESHLASRW